MGNQEKIGETDENCGIAIACYVVGDRVRVKPGRVNAGVRGFIGHGDRGIYSVNLDNGDVMGYCSWEIEGIT